MKKTLILGASTKPERFAYKAAFKLQDQGYEFVPLGLKEGNLFGVPILIGKPPLQNIHTITLYVGPQHQAAWYDYLLELQAPRIIFNPGTENAEFRELCLNQGMEALYACTLVMLATKQY
ncbi:MAG: CoA-binding protein [Microscillaceae bacterium]|nr:CoA-binding protein [Microscillaceae bacterium]